QPGFADTSQTRDGTLAMSAVFEREDERLSDLAGCRLRNLVSGDVSLLFQDLCDTGFEFGIRHFDRVVVGLATVAHTREHVRDRVSHRHECVRSCRGFRCSGPAAVECVWAYQLLLVTPGSSPRCAISRRQTRHRPNLRYTARARPQRWQRV